MPEEKATLIITEKPAAAAKIADALSKGSAKKTTDRNRVSYYEFERDGEKFIVGCAVGHLFGLSQKQKKADFPNFDIEWTPNYEKKNAEYTKKYYNVLKKLIKKADGFIIACDYDIEGEVIGWNVLRFIAGKDAEKNAKRMKFSSLTKKELEKSYKKLHKNIDWGQAIAGETRHYLDWFYGINLSRGLMKALSQTGRFRILSIGRVQGPGLQIVVDKEMKIKNFKPEPFWRVFLLIKDINNKKIEVKYPKDITKESELLKFKQLKGKKAKAETTVKQEKQSPPAPFDLTTLQTEAYRFFKLTPGQTLQIAQNLYLKGLISYPRTSSQKLPESIGYKLILNKLKKYTQLVKYAVNKKPVEGKKSDPAHPSIYPTGESGELKAGDKKIYDLIVRRFISCFAKPALIENKKIEVLIDSLKFYTKGLQIKDKTWMNVYKVKIKEIKLPDINGEVDIKEIRIEEKMTEPPKRYSPASLVRELEKKNLGTKATRAGITETLYSRGYIKGKSIEATPLGINLVSSLKKYSPIILDEELTRKIEREMEDIQLGKNYEELNKKEEKVINEAKENIKKISQDINKNLNKIGKEIGEGHSELWKKEREENMLTQCPTCKKGNLRILYSRQYKRYFIGCSNYPDCRTTFTLPPNGLIKPSMKKNEKTEDNGEKNEEINELCKECGFPLLISFRKGKRPWKFCFNPNCLTNKAWQKKKQEFKEKLGKENSKKDKEN
jgi:DNA topoisomerase-1